MSQVTEGIFECAKKDSRKDWKMRVKFPIFACEAHVVSSAEAFTRNVSFAVSGSKSVCRQVSNLLPPPIFAPPHLWLVNYVQCRIIENGEFVSTLQPGHIKIVILVTLLSIPYSTEQPYY